MMLSFLILIKLEKNSENMIVGRDENFTRGQCGKRSMRTTVFLRI